MPRNEHDIVLDHFGVLEEDQLASGTPTAGTAPIATGTGTAAWGAAASPLIIQDEGTPLTTAASTLNFVGSGVTATGSGSTKTITVPGTDEKVKVSSDDTTPGYLNGKLVAGSNITLNELGDPGDETLEIVASATPINWLGTWSAGTYNANDGVVHDGSSYVALTTTTDEPPSADWQLVAEAGSATITVEEDGDTPVTGVDYIVFDGATVTDDTGGQVTVTITGSSGIGKQLIAFPPGYAASTTAQAPTASAAFAYPITISTEMELRAFAANLTSSASGTYQWGLFDYSSSTTSCTKLAGGSGSMAGVGVQTIAASGGPITITPGSYMLIWLVPAASQGQISRFSGAAGPLGGKSQAAYGWDDTPTLTSGWTATTLAFNVWLKGDLDGSGTQW